MKGRIYGVAFTILSFLFISNIYSFQFGLGTRDFVKKVIEEGQEKGKIPKTEEEKGKIEPKYTGKVDKFNLSEAKYLYLAPKPQPTASYSSYTNGSIIRKTYTSSYQETQKTIFKIKSNGEVEEVKIYDEQGNRFDVDVHYIVKVGTGFISVALEIKGVYIVTTTTQVVNGSSQVVSAEKYIPVSEWETAGSTTSPAGPIDYSQYRKQYLVRLVDGAVYEGKYLPNDSNKKIYEDIYGNYYYTAEDSKSVWWLSSYEFLSNIPRGSIIKLNTKDMSAQAVSAQGDTISTYYASVLEVPFAVDKFGNLAYSAAGTQDYKYRKTTATIDGSNIEHKRFYNYPHNYNHLPPVVDVNRDSIYFIDAVSEGPYGLNNLRVRKVKCNAETGYEVEFTSNVGSVHRTISEGLHAAKILSTGDKEISLLYTWADKIVFSVIDLVKATTSYYYEVDYSTFGVDYTNFSNGFLGYQVVSSTKVYILIKTVGQQVGSYRYTFYAIYPNEAKFEKIFYTEKYEILTTVWPIFNIDEDENIIVTATDLDDGTKNVLKITPNADAPSSHSNISILQRGTAEIFYLVRVY
jgi:hypothetical protein